MRPRRGGDNGAVDIARLHSEAGRDLIRRAGELLSKDPARAAVALRKYVDDPGLASDALAQAEFRAAGVAKFGADADWMFFTRDGLEQSSRAQVARRRAQRLAATGAQQVADLCCGIGADAFALAREGMRVLAVDRDPGVAGIAAANAEALGLADRFEVRCADALAVDLSGCDAGFADPARRIDGRRIFDPARYSPPLPALWDAMRDLANQVCKVGPGIDHAVIPAGAEAEWVSVDGSVVEAALWRGEVATVARRASVLHGESATELTGDGQQQAPVGEIGEYLYEPDGAVIRAHLVAELSEQLDARLGHPDIAYLYTDRTVATPLATGYRIQDVLPFHVKRLRGVLRERGIGRLEIKKRGADLVPDKLRRELKLSGDGAATLIVTRLADRHVALLCDPVRGR